MISCQIRSHLILLGLLSLAGAARAEDKAAFAISATDFRRLSPADQKTLLISAFEHRLERAKNIYYEAQVRLANYEYRNGKIGKKIVTMNGRNYRHWCLGGSYRMDAEKGGPDVTNPNSLVSSGFDTDKGEGKSITRFSGKDRKFARIDVVPNSVTEENRYAYWLDGKHTGWGEYLFRYLVDHKDGYKIETPVDQETIHLTVPWVPRFSKIPLGAREFFLDTQKGFLPLRGKARWDQKMPKGTDDWRTEEFVVEESQLIGDIWMPLKLKELTSCAPIAGKITVWDTKVTKIELGTVQAKDLEVSFPPGTKVVDAIKGIAYIVGSNGEPTRIEHLVGARPGLTSPKAPERKKNMVSIWIGTGLLIIVAFLIAWKLLRRKRAKAVG